MIEQGTLGAVKHFESHFDRFRPEVRVRWREQNVPGSGLWFDLGPHLIDRALQLFGLPQSVQGNIATLRDGAEINDWAHVVLNYPAHKVILHCSMLVAGGSSRFTVHGDKGSVIKARADQQESQLLAGVVPGSAGWGRMTTRWLSMMPRCRPTRRLPAGRSAPVLYADPRCAEGPDRQSGAAGGSAGGDGRSGSGGALC